MSDLFPPFAPDAHEPRKRLFKPVPFRVIAPNLITLLALCLGLTAIRLAYEGRLEPAVDRHRRRGACSTASTGASRASSRARRASAPSSTRLADFVNFGVAPALILYSFVLHDLKALGWIAALVFAIAMALRLARFNVMLDDPNRPEWQKNFFVGMPAPAGAITVAPAALPLISSACRSDRRRLPCVARLRARARLPDGLDDPDLFGQDAGQARAAPLGAADLRADGCDLRPSRQLPFEVLTAITVVFLGTIPVGVCALSRSSRAVTRAGAAAESARAVRVPAADTADQPHDSDAVDAPRSQVRRADRS